MYLSFFPINTFSPFLSFQNSHSAALISFLKGSIGKLTFLGHHCQSLLPRNCQTDWFSNVCILSWYL